MKEMCEPGRLPPSVERPPGGAPLCGPPVRPTRKRSVGLREIDPRPALTRYVTMGACRGRRTVPRQRCCGAGATRWRPSVWGMYVAPPTTESHCPRRKSAQVPLTIEMVI